jgi:HSP90 family molecular chaperone
MKKEDLIKLGLDEETAQKVADASAEELKGFIPKTRFDEVNDAKKKLEGDVQERDKQLEDLKKVDAEGLQKKIEELQATNQSNQEAYDAKIKQIQLDAAVEKALLGAKAKNTNAVKALLELENAEIDGESIKGLDDQLKKLQEAEDTKFLFEPAKAGNTFKGVKPGASGGDPGGGGQPASLADAIKAHLTSSE